MRVNLVQESARHLQMTRARQMRVDTRDLPEAICWIIALLLFLVLLPAFQKYGVMKAISVFY